MVAGVTPWPRRMASHSFGSEAECGGGSPVERFLHQFEQVGRERVGDNAPWVTSVDSRATIARPSALACATSGAISRGRPASERGPDQVNGEEVVENGRARGRRAAVRRAVLGSILTSVASQKGWREEDEVDLRRRRARGTGEPRYAPLCFRGRSVLLTLVCLDLFGMSTLRALREKTEETERRKEALASSHPSLERVAPLIVLQALLQLNGCRKRLARRHRRPASPLRRR